MSEKYKKICMEKNSDYGIYYGSGKYFNDEQNVLHYDINYTVSYFVHCSGNIKIEGNTYNLNSGDIVITCPEEIHCCHINDNSYHEKISVCINKSIFKNFSLNCEELFDFFEKREKGFGNIIRREASVVCGIDVLMEEILRLSEHKSDRNRIMCICKIIELLNRLGNALLSDRSNPNIRNDENPVVSNAINYINEHFTEDINCAIIAEKLFISKYHLEHIFKEYLGVSLWDYVITKRLMLVNALLQKKYSVKEASYMSGFRNYSNFYRLYKKHFSISPAKYRMTLS